MGSGRPWYQADPDAFEQLKDRVTWKYPDLHFLERDGQLFLAGVFPIVDDGRVVDRYRIEVIIPHGGSQSDPPIVREIAGRIPRDPDHHMKSDGEACLFVHEDFWFKHPHGMDLLDFLDGPVRAFFVGHSLMEHGVPWPHGERPHGNAGIADFYSEFLGTSDSKRIKRCLELLSAKKLRAHKRCPCESGRSVRACHLTTLQQLRARIPRRAFLASLAHMKRS